MDFRFFRFVNRRNWSLEMDFLMRIEREFRNLDGSIFDFFVLLIGRIGVWRIWNLKMDRFWIF